MPARELLNSTSTKAMASKPTIQMISSPDHSKHQRFLFHWTGRDIEGGSPPRSNGELPPMNLKKLTAQQRQNYLLRLEETLDPAKGFLARPYHP